MLDLVAIHEAETYLFRLLDTADRDGEIAITRNGRPVATITPLPAANVRRRVRGSWRGEVDMSQFDASDEEIIDEFGILG